MLKLIVFDWDGTLADSVQKILACKRFLAQKYELAAPSELTVRAVLGLKFEVAMAVCFPGARPHTLSQMGEEFHALMKQTDYQADVFPHTKEMLLQLRAQSYRLAIATSKARSELESALIHTGLANFFDATVCSEEYKAKPDPTMLHHLMDLFNVQPDECLMLGDTTTDIQFAHHAGIKIVCVSFGAHTQAALNSLKPWAIIDHWNQLPTFTDHLGGDAICSQKMRFSCRL